MFSQWIPDTHRANAFCGHSIACIKLLLLKALPLIISFLGIKPHIGEENLSHGAKSN